MNSRFMTLQELLDLVDTDHSVYSVEITPIECIVTMIDYSCYSIPRQELGLPAQKGVAELYDTVLLREV